jgi:hypothetical protein
LFVSRCAGRRWRANGKCVLAVLAARKMGVAGNAGQSRIVKRWKT